MISVFTPTNNSKFLPDAYESLKRQTYPDWEWVILYNNGAQPIYFGDPRVKTFTIENVPPWVGYLKAEACERAKGDILVELDHDDLLMPAALEEVNAAFRDPSIGFVYSNTINATLDVKKMEERGWYAFGTPEWKACHGHWIKFSPTFGWKYKEVQAFGMDLDENIFFPPMPDSVSRIWFSPNHLRAFRRSVYKQIGGYSREMRILDDADIMCRMFIASKFKHINKGLCVYRVHDDNTWKIPTINSEIQANVHRVYDKYIGGMARKWADDNNLRKIDLGGRMNPRPGFESVDLEDCDIKADLNERWPFEDNSVGVISAFDILEHLTDPIHTMSEAYRVLAPAGWMFCLVPSTDGRGAFMDPTHKSFWNENSFLYYCSSEYAKYLPPRTPEIKFQAARLYTGEMDHLKTCNTVAHLVSMKDGYRPAGEIFI
jgi:glycosyltransferase involved in cell wall biosynthesis